MADIDATAIPHVTGSVSIAASADLDPSFSNSITNAFSEDGASVLNEAIKVAIEDNNLFTEVVEEESAADFHVTAELVSVLSRSRATLTYTGTCAMNWTCTKMETGQLLYSEKVRSEDRVTVGQAFSGAVRLVKAYEGSVRENIAEALAGIAEAAIESQ